MVLTLSYFEGFHLFSLAIDLSYTPFHYSVKKITLAIDLSTMDDHILSSIFHLQLTSFGELINRQKK